MLVFVGGRVCDLAKGIGSGPAQHGTSQIVGEAVGKIQLLPKLLGESVRAMERERIDA